MRPLRKGCAAQHLGTLASSVASPSASPVEQVVERGNARSWRCKSAVGGRVDLQLQMASLGLRQMSLERALPGTPAATLTFCSSVKGSKLVQAANSARRGEWMAAW